ncbi:hypothetical protein [Stenotrophomonas rhizophila]|uniref:hypothetical protein n=1 Tax=Stenotrophomonas rhizophila TaxID=216778 RepID=UPI001E3073A1|nr:hypothetical protein [Stenotrophomonas rhizophila]MCC7632523.1 hypothetical protein [Stenotrophomonas rhizophila]MCC7663375.1 hypothetical protein [Stenotrophomonas rhizophila]
MNRQDLPLNLSSSARRVVRRAIAWAALAAVPLSGCAGNHVKPSYSKSSVEPVVVTKVSDSTLRVQFNDPLESMYYAAGISYAVEAGVMKIVIDRCPISGNCTTMLRRHVVPGPPEPAVQEIPLLAPIVVMVFADGEEQVFPLTTAPANGPTGASLKQAE